MLRGRDWFERLNWLVNKHTLEHHSYLLLLFFFYSKRTNNILMATTFKDRTNEFHAMCERIQSRHSAPTNVSERRALLSSQDHSSPSLHKSNKKAPHARSEFSMMAAEISRQITNTAAKLEKLTKCEFSRSCFYLVHFVVKIIEHYKLFCSGQEKDIIRRQTC